VKKFSGGATTHYVWQGGQVIAEHNGSTGTVITEYIYAGSRMVAREQSGRVFFLYDRLSARATITDGQGNITGRQAHLPFGEELNATGTTDKHQFTNYEKDSETGTDYAVNRQYMQGLGRFMRPDPYDGSYLSGNPQSLNRYAYAKNDPVNATDPLGLCVCYIVNEAYIECTLCYGNLPNQSGRGRRPEERRGGQNKDRKWTKEECKKELDELYLRMNTTIAAIPIVFEQITGGASFADEFNALVESVLASGPKGSQLSTNPEEVERLFEDLGVRTGQAALDGIADVESMRLEGELGLRTSKAFNDRLEAMKKGGCGGTLKGTDKVLFDSLSSSLVSSLNNIYCSFLRGVSRTIGPMTHGAPPELRPIIEKNHQELLGSACR
jgi:RHS repeat-associated protein